MEQSTKRDAAGVYGEHVAMKLRNYGSQTFSVVQHLINNILFDADMGRYTHYTQTTNYPPQLLKLIQLSISMLYNRPGYTYSPLPNLNATQFQQRQDSTAPLNMHED